MKKISIIIPVYNRERHLEECVNSILLSIENDVEIIIVDDGSTDGTSEICDKLKKRSKCVKVIHQPNKGVASARNTGLSAASGEWIAWVDSDDLVSASYIRTLKKCIASIDTDIIIFEYATFTNSNDVSIKMPISNNIREIRKDNGAIKANVEENIARPVPAWLEKDAEKLSGKVVRLAEREEVDLPVE